MDPVTAIANGIGSIFDFISGQQQTRPDWLDPRDFQQQNDNLYLSIGLGVIFIILIIAIAYIAVKK